MWTLSRRQKYGKDAAASARFRAAPDAERTTVLLHYIFGQGESQTAAAGSLRGKAGLEYFVQVFRRYPAAVICESHPQTVSLLP
jgi:hypothetical protein